MQSALDELAREGARRMLVEALAMPHLLLLLAERSWRRVEFHCSRSSAPT